MIGTCKCEKRYIKTRHYYYFIDNYEFMIFMQEDFWFMQKNNYVYY